MNGELIAFGQVHPDLDPAHLQHDTARRLLEACHRHTALEVIELRRVEFVDKTSGDITSADIIVVDCADGTVPSRNPVGIKNRERLAVVYHPSSAMPHHVRTLRVGFPVTLHQNHVNMGEPASLCLYFEPWSNVERRWTPQRHLERILWWLRETALGTLHRTAQPLEQLYFNTPYQVVLPPDFHERATDQRSALHFEPVDCGESKPKVYRGIFKTREELLKQGVSFADALVLALQPVTPGPVEHHPWTLGALHDQLAARGSGLIDELKSAIQAAVSANGVAQCTGQRYTLLFLRIPRVRATGGEIEHTDARGFVVHADLARLGIAAGSLFDGHDKKAYIEQTSALAGVTGAAPTSTSEWHNLTIEPIDVRLGITRRDARRASGVSETGAEFQGVLAGVGALGSVLAELWSRAGWGNWTFIDDDILRAHNVVRHIGKDVNIGMSKANIVARMVERNYYPGQATASNIGAKVTDTANNAVMTALSSAALVVDATTTLEAPRELAHLNAVPRSVSVFLTPSGLGSVLLLEDDSRSLRLSGLEAQYYRAVLRSDWGAKHLDGHYGELWVGGGCRDVSAVLSNELIQLHGSTLARQVRLLAALPDAAIRIWSLDNSSGALSAEVVPASRSHSQVLGEWHIVWDEGLHKYLRKLRAAKLPNETGGVLLGYLDQKLKTLHLVDALPEPSDSEADCSGFTRGTKGLKDALEECGRRTANIVTYVGEWHSHPKHVPVRPSSPDVQLLAHLADVMALDGLPALMAIVGERDVGFSLGQFVCR